MKIKVGKTYKSGEGREIYIEHQISRQVGAIEAGSFMGICVSYKTYAWYKEDGTRIFAHSEGAKAANLLPNITKVVKWVVIWQYKLSTSLVGSTLYDTEKDANDRIKAVSDYYRPYIFSKKIEWEIENEE